MIKLLILEASAAASAGAALAAAALLGAAARRRGKAPSRYVLRGLRVERRIWFDPGKTPNLGVFRQNFGRMLLVFGCIGSDFCN